MPALDFTKKIAVCITTMPRGIGRTIFKELGKMLKKGSKIVLITHKGPEARKVTTKVKADINRDVIVEAHIVDFADPKSSVFETIIDNMFLTIVKNQFEMAVIFHNAVTFGMLDTTTTLTDRKVWREACDMNLVTPALLNANFVKRAKTEVKTMFVVNHMPLFGRTAHKYMAMSGAMFAARNLYFQTLVVEEPNVTVLGYSPGLVHVPMMNAIAGDKNNPEVKKQIAQWWVQKKVVPPEEIVQRLIKILEDGKYKSGDFVDFN